MIARIRIDDLGKFKREPGGTKYGNDHADGADRHQQPPEGHAPLGETHRNPYRLLAHIRV